MVADGLISFEVPKDSELSRNDIKLRLRRASVYVVSLLRKNATTLERQAELADELRDVRTGNPAPLSPKVLAHPRTVATLQLLARLDSSVQELRGVATDGKATAGDARLFDTFRLIERHIELVKARGFSLPKPTREVIVKKFDWHGADFAQSALLLRTELLDEYRETLRKVARDARKAARATTDEHTRAQYTALRRLAERLHKSIAVTAMIVR